MKRAHVIFFSDWIATGRTGLRLPKDAQKIPAMIEDLASTYFNIGDSQQPLTHR
jgi:hypothetical protein